MALNRFIKPFILITICEIMGACTTTEQTSALTNTHQMGAPQQLKFQLSSGVYSCELGHRIDIQRSANLIKINWLGTSHTLQRYDSASGLPRYENRKNGLLWIDLPWKGVLMDTNSGQPLANECKLASR